MMNKSFAGVCPFSELAMCYFTLARSKRTAVIKMRKLIEEDASLSKRLYELGYTSKTQDITPKMREAIVQVLGTYKEDKIDPIEISQVNIKK